MATPTTAGCSRCLYLLLTLTLTLTLTLALTRTLTQTLTLTSSRCCYLRRGSRWSTRGC